MQIHNPPEEMLTSFSSMVELGISKESPKAPVDD
jgi:hypothetical protein